MMSGSNSTASSAIPPSILSAYTNPDHEKFQKIREQYHGILENLQRKIDESGDAGVPVEELDVFLAEANIVFTEVKRPQEARLDISVLKQLLLLAKSNIEKTTSNLLVFKPCEFADKLVSYCKNLTDNRPLEENVDNLFDLPEDSLRTLESEVSTLYSHTCGLEPIYGALEWKPPKRKISQRAAAARGPAIAKLIQKVENLTTREESNVDEVSRINNILVQKYKSNRSQPFGFLEFVINPKSFSATIENIFHVSFLLRDGFIEIKPDKFKVPCIAPVKRNEHGSRSTSDNIDCQSIVSMNLEEWEEAVEILELKGKEPMIPKTRSATKKRHNQSV